MNITKDVFENKWEQIRAQSQTWWKLFTDDDLKKVDKAPIKFDKYAMMLRVKYGYTHERAKDEISKRIAGLETNPPSDELVPDRPNQQGASVDSKIPKRQTNSEP